MEPLPLLTFSIGFALKKKKSVKTLFKSLLNKRGAVQAHFFPKCLYVFFFFFSHTFHLGLHFFFPGKAETWITYPNVAASWNCQEKDYLENQKKTELSFFLH